MQSSETLSRENLRPRIREVVKAVRSLNRTSATLRTIAVIAGLATLVGVMIIFVSQVLGPTMIAQTKYVSSIAFFIAVGSLLIFEVMKRLGEQFFAEISEEYQWFYRKRQTRILKNAVTPALNIRLCLKKFDAACDLPFVPGEYGPIIYLLINLMHLSYSTFFLLSNH